MVNNIIQVDQTLSTNELAKLMLKEKKISLPFLIQSEYQTKGKGQYNKSWESNAKENLLMSLVLKAPTIDIEKQFDISKAVAVALLKVISNYTEKKISIKWPNDIYVEDKKIAGVLIENTIVGNKIDACVIGIGLNINQTLFSSALPNPVSLKQLTARNIDVTKVRNELVVELENQISNLNQVSSIYLENLYKKDFLSRFADKEGNEFIAVILGVDEIGRLELRLENQVLKTFVNNEIKFLLPEMN